MSILDKVIILLFPNQTVTYSGTFDQNGNGTFTLWPQSNPPQPTQAQIQAVWAQAQSAQAKEDNNRPLLAQIAGLEARQHRATREAALGMAGAVAKLQTLDASIAALRAKFV